MAQSPPPGQTPPVSWSPPPPTPAGPTVQGFSFNDFISFRYLITPAIITVIYILGAIAISIGGIVTMGSPRAGGVLAGLAILVLGNIYWRVILEFFVVLFRMNDSLRSIDRRGRGM